MRKSSEEWFGELGKSGSVEPSAVFPPDAGYVYALVNPVWPGMVKLGLAGSVKRRFFSYLTGDPFRAYRMLAWSDVLVDTREAERAIHARFEERRVPGSKEWFRITESQAIAALNALRKQPMASAQCMPFDAADDWYTDD